MNTSDSYYLGFYPKDERQRLLFDDFRRLRAIYGMPHPFAYLRSLARTRRYTRTVYPPGWNAIF